MTKESYANVGSDLKAGEKEENSRGSKRSAEEFLFRRNN